MSDYIVTKPWRYRLAALKIGDPCPPLSPTALASKLRTGHVAKRSPNPGAPPARPQPGPPSRRQPGPPAREEPAPPVPAEPAPPEKKDAPTGEADRVITIELEGGEEAEYMLDATRFGLLRALEEVDPSDFRALQGAISALSFPGKDARGRREQLVKKRAEILDIVAPHMT